MLIFIISIIVVSTVLFLIGTFSLKKTKGELIESEHVLNEQIQLLSTRAHGKQVINDYRGAIAVADKILFLEPTNYKALIIRANCLGAMNYNLDSIEDYEKALSIDNSDANIFGLLGLTYIRVGEVELAEENLKISIDKGWDLYQMNYELLLDSPEFKESIRKKGKAAERRLRRNLENFSDDLSNVDKIELKKAFKSGIKHLENALSIDPSNQQLKDLFETAKRQIE